MTKLLEKGNHLLLFSRELLSTRSLIGTNFICFLGSLISIHCVIILGFVYLDKSELNARSSDLALHCVLVNVDNCKSLCVYLIIWRLRYNYFFRWEEIKKSRNWKNCTEEYLIKNHIPLCRAKFQRIHLYENVTFAFHLRFIL